MCTSRCVLPNYNVVFEIRVPVLGAQGPGDAVYAASLHVQHKFNLNELRTYIQYMSCEEISGGNEPESDVPK